MTMISQHFTPATAQSTGNVRYFTNHHAAKATEIAHHTRAVNALAMSSWHLSSDTGSLRLALTKVDQARESILKLISMEGGV
jgi:hypothetical protein